MTTTLDLPAILAKHAAWWRGQQDGERANLRGADLSYANLSDANLRGANLSYADLSDANLSAANLSGADLSDANLSYADLSDANLSAADLSDADLRYANLSYANLRYANLSDANLSYATLPTGERWEAYLTEVVPQLLLAGERGLDAVRAWDKHTWIDCPISVAFSIHSPTEAPALLRPRIEQFVQLFDAGLIPQPLIEGSRMVVPLSGTQAVS